MYKKNLLVIGGSHGIGESLAQILDLNHWNPLYLCRTQGNLDSQSWRSFDILNESDIAECKNFLPETIDALVYCPGSINLKPFAALKVSDFLESLEINVLGAIKILQVALPRLKKSTSASVVGFSTVATQVGLPYHTSIASAKGALDGLFLSLSSEFAPQIRFNLIAPSLTETPLASKLLSNEKMREASEQKHPLKKIGHPKDVASMVMFLLSEEAKFMTGQIISMDGGMGRLRN